MIKILHDTSQMLFKEVFSFHKIFICMFFTFPTSIVSEVDNITVVEADVNDTVYNDTYVNITFLNQNITDFDIDNKTSDASTELESTIGVTEDTDISFQNENNKKLFLFLTPDEDICNCDLTENVCDINCCCDPDCDEEDMQVFSECSHQVLTPDENYCYQKDIIFRNNTIYKMVKDPSSSLFCIVRDNFKHRLRFKDMPILKSHRDLVTVLKYKHSTTYSWDTESEKKTESSKLRAGSPVDIDVPSNKNNKITSRWSLPSSCLSDLCTCHQEVRYLRDIKTSCTHRIPDLTTRCSPRDPVLSGDHVAGEFCIRQPAFAEGGGSSSSLAQLVLHTEQMLLGNASEYEDAPRSLCVKRNPRRPAPSGSGGCRNVVSSVHFVVEHDGPRGIVSVRAEFGYVDLGNGSESLTQSYGVSFVWSNASGDDAEGRRSGNPGYHVGLPVLASDNATDAAPGTFPLSVFGREPDGACSVSARRPVAFGRNLRTGCVLALHHTSDCDALRRVVHRTLMGTPQPVFVGAFGNANASDPDDWIEVFHDSAAQALEEAAETDGGVPPCAASVGLQVEVLYAAVGSVANPQNKIVGVAFRRGAPEPVDRAGFLRLRASVSFLDVTLPAVRHRAKVPSVRVNLPDDFFYPFLYSSAAPQAANVLGILLVLLVVYLLGMAAT